MLEVSTRAPGRRSRKERVMVTKGVRQLLMERLAMEPTLYEALGTVGQLGRCGVECFPVSNT